jgi:uncharacterized OB-fold protein
LIFSQPKPPEISFVAQAADDNYYAKANQQETAMSDQPYPLWSAEPVPHLLASRDRATGEWIFPALPADSPLADGHETVAVTGTGVLYSFTVIHPAPKSGLAPYALGYVDFVGPVRIFGRLLGTARPVIGERYAQRHDAELGYVFEAVTA